MAFSCTLLQCHSPRFLARRSGWSMIPGAKCSTQIPTCCTGPGWSMIPGARCSAKSRPAALDLAAQGRPCLALFGGSNSTLGLSVNLFGWSGFSFDTQLSQEDSHCRLDL